MKKVIPLILFLILAIYFTSGYIIRYEIPIYDVDQVLDYENFTENFTLATDSSFFGNVGGENISDTYVPYGTEGIKGAIRPVNLSKGTITPNITTPDGTLEILSNITTEFINNVKLNRTIDSANNRAILNIYLG